jgi:hypothetical protein
MKSELADSQLVRIRHDLDKYRDQLPWETYRRYRNGIFPSVMYILLQAPDLAQTIADIAKEQETSYAEQP